MSVLPAWERLRSDGAGRLRVERPRSVRVQVLTVVDGDLPELDGATIFDAWRTSPGYRLRAAAIRKGLASTWELQAGALHLVGPDPALLDLLRIDPSNPPPDVRLEGAAQAPLTEPGLVCGCRGVREDAVVHALAAGWWSADAVKRATRVAFGECQGRRCLPLLAARLELEPDTSLAKVTPRPPLVPVPASVLAAFVSYAAGE